MKALMQKEWRLAMTPVPLVFLALSALVLVPSYPYYVTFFYTTLGIFLFFQSARENRDVSYMLLLPVGKRQMVYARVWTVAQLELLQLLCCVPFLCIRAGYGIQNAVGIEANCAFLGFGAVLLGAFNLVFLPMHYKNGYDLGKPFVLSSIVMFLGICVLEVLEHIVPYMKTVCERYDIAGQLQQLPVLLGGLAIYAGLTVLAAKISAARFEKADL